MDEMTLLKDAYDEARPRVDVHHAARARLLQEIAGEQRVSSPRFLPRLPVLKVVATSAALSLVLAATSVALLNRGEESPAPRQQVAESADPREKTVTSASRILLVAAVESRARDATFQAPRPDQYIYVRQAEKVAAPDGGPAKTFVNEAWVSVDGSRPSFGTYRGHSSTVPPGGEVDGMQQAWPPVNYAELEMLPTDPQQLVVAVRTMARMEPADVATAGGPNDPIYSLLTTLLTRPVLPPGLQGATFEALAGLADVRVSPESFDGRAAIGIRNPHGRETVILDSDTYEYLGQRYPDQYGSTTVTLEASGIVDELEQRP